MSTTTSNLKLIAPELTDEVHQTLQDLAANFRTLDRESEIKVDRLPTSGYWEKGQKVYYKNVSPGSYIGAVNVQAGEAAPQWKSINVYSLGDKVVPTVYNGHVYNCVQSGYSGPNEPVWPTTANGFVEDIQAYQYWKPSHFYDLFDIVLPAVPNGRFYVCTAAGTSGTSEPVWSVNDGVATSDNGAVWTGYRRARWQESGPAADFHHFGKIE